MSRSVLRLCIALLLVISSTSFLLSGWRLVSDWPGSLLIERTGTQIAAYIDLQMTRAVTLDAVAVRLTDLLEESPRNWLAIEAVEEVAADYEVNIPHDIEQLRDELYLADTGFWATATSCLGCAVSVESCEFSLIIMCRAPIDLTPVGDVVGVVREGGNYLLGRDVDMVDLGLSAVGLTAVAVMPLTGGTSGGVKVGAGISKMAWRMGSLSPDFLPPFRRAVREGFDWTRIGLVRSQADLALLARPEILAPAVGIVRDAGRVADAVGSQRALYLLSRAESPTELRQLAAISEQIGPRAVGALELIGKSRLVRTSMRYADEVWYMVVGLVGILASVAMLAGNALVTIASRSLRSKLRGLKGDEEDGVM
jgi:hypothetical protein